MSCNYLCFLILFASSIAGAWQVCLLNEIIESTSMRIDHSPVYVAKESLDYVHGGVTFIYPTNIFSTAPKIYITIELKDASYSSIISYTAVVTSNSATSATIRVNKVAAISLVEAGTDDVTVHVYAFG